MNLKSCNEKASGVLDVREKNTKQRFIERLRKMEIVKSCAHGIFAWDEAVVYNHDYWMGWIDEKERLIDDEDRKMG